jgi:anti-sigma B factor antagonist
LGFLGTTDDGSEEVWMGDRELLTVEVERLGDRASVISVGGELDLSTISMLERRLLDQVRSRRSVILDLTPLTFIDSSGIGLLIGAFRAANGSAMHVVIARESQVERVFTIAGIDLALPVFRDRSEAVNALDDGDLG